MRRRPIFGGMEGGGTKFYCLVATGPHDILAEKRFSTTTPEETIDHAITFFEPFAHQGLAAIGLAPFGPLQLNPKAPAYGCLRATPKSGWSGVDVLRPFRLAFGIPMAFDLDVNAAAFGEYVWVPTNRRLDSLVYFTIGTGIGAGVIFNGRIVHGLTHPEAGHMRIPHDRIADPFGGSCPFHGDCFEGLASGPAITQRWGKPAESLPDNHPAWELETTYIALALVNMICDLSPQRIVLGGGVMGRRFLFPAIQKKVQVFLNAYIDSPLVRDNPGEFIVPPALGKRSGVLGAVAMAKNLVVKE